MQRVAIGLVVVLAAAGIWWVATQPPASGGAVDGEPTSGEVKAADPQQAYDEAEIDDTCAEVLGFVKQRHGQEGLEKMGEGAVAKKLSPDQIAEFCRSVEGLDGDALEARIEAFTGITLP